MEQKFNYFNEIGEDQWLLRIWNITAMAYNLGKDFGNHVMQEYLVKLNEDERMRVALLTMSIKRFGYEETKKKVMEQTVFIEEDEGYRDNPILV